MATQPALPNLPAPRSPRRSTRRSSSARAVPKAKLTHFLPHEISDYPRSADIAGRAVTISPDVPLGFDQPLAAHHKIIGGWVAASDRSATRFPVRRLRPFLGERRQRKPRASKGVPAGGMTLGRLIAESAAR